MDGGEDMDLQNKIWTNFCLLATVTFVKRFWPLLTCKDDLKTAQKQLYWVYLPLV
jgi:hypothetical protein